MVDNVYRSRWSCLHGSAVYTERREAHDVAEVDGDALELLGLHHLAGHQLLCHLPETRDAFYSLSIVTCYCCGTSKRV